MKKSIIISEADNIAALVENDRVVEFFVNRGELLLGDIYVAIVENILPGIDAAFVNLGKDKMGFLHANDIPGEGALRDRLVPKQKLLVQITKEPTGHKGPRVSTAISLPGRFLVLVPEERGISISRRISESKERAKLKSVVTLMKPPGVGVIIRTEAKGQNEASLYEDFEQLWDRWQSIVSEGEASIGPKLVYRDQDLLYRVIRDAYSTDVTEIVCDTQDGQRRAAEFMSGWAGRTTKVVHHSGDDQLLISRGIDKDIETVLSDRAELPSGGHLNIQPTEALTVIDVNSGRFTSSRTQAETVRKTNIEAAQEIPRQLRLRNIGGMVIVDFIDMESRRDQQQVLEVFNRALEDDRAKPQVGQMSDLGLVELTRRRQGQSLRELFAETCPHCSGTGAMPTLTLGTGENKRVISFSGKDDESSKAKIRRGQQQQQRGGTQLRAASATGQRLQQTMQDFDPADAEGLVADEAILDVPEDILEQMPDELLDAPLAAPERARSNYPDSNEDANGHKDNESDDSDEEDDEPVAATSSYQRNNSPSPQRYAAKVEVEVEADDDDEDEAPAARHVPTSISVVDTEDDDDDDDVEKKDEVATPQVEDDDDEDESSSDIATTIDAELIEPTITVEATPMPLPESNFQTEFDPVTGIYRLKPKEKIEIAESDVEPMSSVLSEDGARSQESYYQDDAVSEVSHEMEATSSQSSTNDSRSAGSEGSEQNVQLGLAFNQHGSNSDEHGNHQHEHSHDSSQHGEHGENHENNDSNTESDTPRFEHSSTGNQEND